MAMTFLRLREQIDARHTAPHPIWTYALVIALIALVWAWTILR